MSRIGFIGTGHIAAPMARFLARKGHDVVVSERNAGVAGALVAAFPAIEIKSNQGVVDSADIIFLCLRPHLWAEIVPNLTFRADQQIVSVMAGVTLADLYAACAPASQISMTIPIGFLEFGGCPLPSCPDDVTLGALFAPENPVLPVPDEAAFTQHFAASALLSAVLGVMEEGSDWLGEVTGDAKQSEIYVAALISGFLADMPKDGQARLAEYKNGLATKGTLNLQMVEGLENGDAFKTLRTTLDAIGKRMAQA
jgi:pyrroline-5-carboxylate reductase